MAKYRANSSDTWKTLKIKALDSLPVGSQIEFTGTDVPTGWTQVNDYSTSEIDTGKTWIDGKHIYRKVLEGTTPSSANAWGNIGSVSNVSTLISMSGILGGYLPAPVYVNSSYLVALQKSGSNIQAYTVGYTSTSIKIIIEYTKSS